MTVNCTMKNYTILPMTIDHYDEIYGLWRTDEGVGLSGADSRGSIAVFLERNPGLSFIAADGVRIIGTILGGHDGRRGYVHHLIVDPAFRSRGIGAELLGECLKGFAETGIGKSHVFVFRNNVRGIGFWRKMGYELRDDLFMMSRSIG